VKSLISDVAVGIADGVRTISNVQVLPTQESRPGPARSVGSTPTIWRSWLGIDEQMVAAVARGSGAGR